MLVGQTIGNPEKGEIKIEKELGSGAMGTVYRATLAAKGRKLPVALKIVSLGLVGNESAMARFDREAAILQQLRHPHIVRLYGTGKYRGTPYIAMEYVDGEPMDRMLTRRGRLGWDEVLGYGKQLCEALQHAHEKGIIHRDLKPSNLMLTKGGVLKLTDFGIAKDTDVTALTGANSTIGTAAYMSPEQCRGNRELTPKSDLYSLGIVFYELITGKKPFYAETTMDMFLKHVNDVPLRPSKYVPDLPIWVDNLIMHLMEKPIETRPMDAATVARMISQIEEKVQSLQSAGLEVATARRVDRKLNDDAPITDEDREAARALKGKKKKKRKKAVPFAEQTWWKALAFGTLLLGIVATGIWLLLPAGPEKAFDSVASASADEKLDKLRAYLGSYGTVDHPKVAEAKAMFKELRTREVEKTFLKRIGSGDPDSFNRRKAMDGEDQAVMDAIWAAIEAERAGDLKKAAEKWSTVARDVPDLDPAKFGDEDAARIPPYRWAAERHIAELKAVSVELQRLGAAYEKAQTDESFPTQPPDSIALKAMRYEKFGDPPAARIEWDELSKSVASDPDKLRWQLLAVERRQANTNSKISPEEALKNRRNLASKKAAAISADWDSVKSNAQKLVEHRSVRNECRTVIDLYKGEVDPELAAAVKSAERILAAAQPK